MIYMYIDILVNANFGDEHEVESDTLIDNVNLARSLLCEAKQLQRSAKGSSMRSKNNSSRRIVIHCMQTRRAALPPA